MLLYLGHPEVALLDGGFPAWKAENPGRIEKGASRRPPPGDFEPVPLPDRRIRLDALRTALAELAGPLRPGAPVVTYCTGGVRSALLAVLLEARLGVVAANYDGSLWEWSARDDLPLETGR